MKANVLIRFEMIDTGRKLHGETVVERKYNVQGDEVDVFAVLCDVVHTNPKFKKLLEAALQFDREHDHSNCPHCRPKN